MFCRPPQAGESLTPATTLVLRRREAASKGESSWPRSVASVLRDAMRCIAPQDEGTFGRTSGPGSLGPGSTLVLGPRHNPRPEAPRSVLEGRLQLAPQRR